MIFQGILRVQYKSSSDDSICGIMLITTKNYFDSSVVFSKNKQNRRYGEALTMKVNSVKTCMLFEL